MRELVRYLCSSCGGALIVDRNQGVYDCPFCGNAFDAAALHRDEVLADAENNMKQREFHSAKEKFDSLLANDTKDFDAQRGLVLCAGKLPSVNTLRKPDKVNDGDTQSFQKALADVLKSAREEDIPYFEKMSEILGIAKEHKQLVDAKRKLDKEYELAKAVHKEKNSATGSFSIFLFIASVVVFYIWFLSDPNSFVNCAIFVIPGGLALFTAVLLIPQKIEDKRFDKEEHGFRVKKHELTDKISEVEERYSRAFDELNKLDVSDKRSHSPVESPIENLAEE